MSTSYNEEISGDAERKLQIVLDHVTANARHNSEHEDLRSLRAALDDGDRLTGKILSGGYTNYSYQLYLENNPDFRLFAKLCFAYALWCPGDNRPHYDLERQSVEFNLMKRFSKEVRGEGKAAVPTPYLLVNVSDEMRILVTQWAPADEQFANQFIEGHIDKRVFPKVARTLAAITLADVDDPNLNSTLQQNLSTMLEKPFGDAFQRLYEKPHDYDTCIAYLNKIGRERFGAIMKGRMVAHSTKQCLVHSDSHVFNMLVEGKPDVSELQSFGKSGDFFLCDWEMSHVGASGQDIGLFLSFPLACSYFHAAQGHEDSSHAILEALDSVWQEYANCLREGGKDEDYITLTYRNVLGFCGWFIFASFYTLHKQIEFVDTSGLSLEETDLILALLGATALKMMEWAWTDETPAIHSTLIELKTLYNCAVSEDITTILAQRDSSDRITSNRPHRRSSVLRTSARRVSDAGMMESALGLVSKLEEPGR